MYIFVLSWILSSVICWSHFSSPEDKNYIHVSLSHDVKNENFSPNHYRSRLAVSAVDFFSHEHDQQNTHVTSSFKFNCSDLSRMECMARAARAAYAITDTVGVSDQFAFSVVDRGDYVTGEKMLADPHVSQNFKDFLANNLLLHPVAKDKNTVILMGDSTIDNIAWVGGHTFKDDDVTHQLRALLGSQYSVINYAADCFETKDVLNGRDAPYFNVRPDDDRLPEKHFAPLIHTDKLIKTHNVTHIVLSIGGNDIRVILGKMRQGQVDELKRAAKSLQNNYQLILKQLKSIAPSATIILMTQYCPDRNDKNGPYKVYESLQAILPNYDPLITMHALMQVVYEPIIATARAEGFMVADMTNSLNPNDSTLYKQQIEPGKLGGQIIASLLAHIIKNENSPFSESNIYSSTRSIKDGNTMDTIKVNVNSHDPANPWRVTAPITDAAGIPIAIIPNRNDSAAIQGALAYVRQMLTE